MLSPIRSMALAVAFLLSAAPTAWSQQSQGKPAPEEKSGLKVGEKAPSFTLKDQEGADRSLDDLLEEGQGRPAAPTAPTTWTPESSIDLRSRCSWTNCLRQ